MHGGARSSGAAPRRPSGPSPAREGTRHEGTGCPPATPRGGAAALERAGGRRATGPPARTCLDAARTPLASDLTLCDGLTVAYAR